MNGRELKKLPPISSFEANSLVQRIAQRVFALRQILRADDGELSDQGYLDLQEDLAPILNHVLAADTIVEYMRCYPVNYTNKHHLTLLHLLVLFAPDLVELLVTNPEFTRINYECFSATNHLCASALDLAIDRWMEGRCGMQVIILLLKHGALAPEYMDFINIGNCLLVDLCKDVLFNPAPNRNVEEVIQLLVLLGRYGFEVKEAFQALNTSWFADRAHIADIASKANCGVLHQDYIITRLEEAVLKKLESAEKANIVVEMTPDRYALAPSPRRLSKITGNQAVFFDPPPAASVMMADVLYGVDNKLTM